MEGLYTMANNIPSVPDPIGSELVKEDPSFADIVGEFVEGLSARLTAMEEALRGSDFETLRTAAHQLKGSGGGYGYPLVTERATELEQHARAQAHDDCVQSFGELQRICSRIVVDPAE